MPSYLAFSMAGLIMIGICVLILCLGMAYIVIRRYRQKNR